MNKDYESLLRGEGDFIEDLIEKSSPCFVEIVGSPVAKGAIKIIDDSESLKIRGVLTVLTARSIQGENQIGGMVRDEPLLAQGEVSYIGQPLAIVVAENREAAVLGAKAAAVEIDEETPVFCPRASAEKGDLIVPARTIKRGDTEKAWAHCRYVVSGSVETGGQEHVYLETQGALAVPGQGGRMTVHSATQSPTAVQRNVAKVLGKEMNDIEVDTKRLGGAFGGKEDQATPYACMAALAASKVKRPAALVLSRSQDMAMTGKRHPYSSDFKLGLDENHKFIAYEVAFYQNAGAHADLSPAVLERTLFHAVNSYDIPNVTVHGFSCRVNLPPNTAFRGFGGPQGMFVMEAAVAEAAEKLGLESHVLQRKNIMKEGRFFHYGMKLQKPGCDVSFDRAVEEFGFSRRLKEIKEFNRKSPSIKKGISIMPVCFGISFTTTFLNQGGALVHIYTDGSVSLNTGAVDMGQGVSVKLILIASSVLGVPVERISVESTNTRRVANTSPTAASTAVDLNGGAVELACKQLVKRLKKSAAEELNSTVNEIAISEGRVKSRRNSMSWEELIAKTYMKRVNLSAQACYSTPKIYYDKGEEKGKPFAYHVTGAAITEVELDCSRGVYEVKRVDVAHDAGKSLAPLVDLGQVEGALVQGIGWVTIEEPRYRRGRLISDNLATYKVPDIKFVPEINTFFLEESEGPAAVMKTKGVGEPPLMYGIGAYFALLSAMKSFRPIKAFYSSPLTYEKVLMKLYEN